MRYFTSFLLEMYVTLTDFNQLLGLFLHEIHYKITSTDGDKNDFRRGSVVVTMNNRSCGYPLKPHIKYLTHIFKDMYFIRIWIFKRSWMFLKRRQSTCWSLRCSWSVAFRRCSNHFAINYVVSEGEHVETTLINLYIRHAFFPSIYTI